MKTKLFLFLSFLIIGLSSCKEKDSDIQSALSEKFKSNPELSNLNTEVKDGVATISGEIKDQNSKPLVIETAKVVKGVKSVIDNTTIPAPIPLPVVETKNEGLNQGVNDAVKDLPSVHGDVKDSIIILTGEIKRSELPKLMEMLHSLKPKKIENKLTIK